MNTDVDATTCTQLLKDRAIALGFDLCGVAPATAGLGEQRLRSWLEQGRHGEMSYMQRHLEARLDPHYVLQDVKSVVVVGLGYRPAHGGKSTSSKGRISIYAQGRDYHDVLREKLTALGHYWESVWPDAGWRAVVDSAPLMERDYANLAGLGWFGKNTLLLNKKLGSYFFLGALLVTAELHYDVPHETAHCGTCTRCLDACPTDAFDGPYQLDPRRCISYLTIEHRSAIPMELRQGMGNWIFGCDVCQEVCPWNRKAPPTSEHEFLPNAENNGVDLLELLSLDDGEFRKRFRGTPLFRTKRDRVLRNACIAAGNSGDRRFVERLSELAQQESGELREAAQWALDILLHSSNR